MQATNRQRKLDTLDGGGGGGAEWTQKVSDAC